MFRGATLVNLDSKGRLSVPTRYRDQLIENAAVKWFAPLTLTPLPAALPLA
jgi:MraZ protein